VIKIISIGRFNILENQAIVRVNQQTVVYDGSTKTFEVSNFLNIPDASALASVIVELNGRVLTSIDTQTSQFVESNEFIVATDPFESTGTVLANNLKVYINGQLKTFVTDYVFDANTKLVTINRSLLSVGDNVVITNDLRAEFSIAGNLLTIKDQVDIDENDVIRVTWFGRYDNLKLISDEYKGGKVHYKLPSTPLSDSYVWVYKNGSRLVLGNDYRVDGNLVYLKGTSSTNDLIKIINFGSTIYIPPVAYEIHKDMLNVYNFKGISRGNMKLSKDLNYFDKTIELNNADELVTPDYSKKLTGTVYINGERIEYLQKAGNTLSQLRRGVQGTSIPVTHSIGSTVVDVGPQATIPYRETHENLKFESLNQVSFVYDGSTTAFNISDQMYVGKGEKENILVLLNNIELNSNLYQVSLSNQNVILEISNEIELVEQTTITVISMLVGPLPFIPAKANRASWFNTDIPEVYGPCDQVEVFEGGRRLRKDPLSVYDEELGYYSQAATKQLQAEFSVSGDESYIRLSKIPEKNATITVVRRLGRTWHERGSITASSGKTLLAANTSIVNFITEKTTLLPE
jgi:hypothetical protein